MTHVARLSHLRTTSTLSAKMVRAHSQFSARNSVGLVSLEAAARQIGGSISLGDEPGSASYANAGSMYLAKTQALSSPRLTVSPLSPGLQPVHPFGFTSQHLDNGDILVAKDGPVGSVSILQWNSTSTSVMVSSGIVRVRMPSHEWFYYGILRFGSFTANVDLLTPRQATYRHAGVALIRSALVPTPLPYGEPQQRIAALTKLACSCEDELAARRATVIRTLDTLVGAAGQSANGLPPTVASASLLATSRRLDASYLAAQRSSFAQLLAQRSSCSFAEAVRANDLRVSRGQNLQFTSIGYSEKHDDVSLGDWRLLEPNFIQKDFGIPRYRWLWCPRALKTIGDGQVLVSAEGTVGNVTVFREEPDYPTVSNIHAVIIDSAAPNREMHNAWLAANIAYLRDKGWLDAISVGGQGGSLAIRYWNQLPLLDFDASAGRCVFEALIGSTPAPSLAELENVDSSVIAEITRGLGRLSSRELDALRFRASTASRLAVAAAYPQIAAQ